MSATDLFTRAATHAQCEPAQPHHLVNHPYLTDGVGLYRFLGWIIDERFAEFEDCHSLDLILVPTRELVGRGLRSVTPAQLVS